MNLLWNKLKNSGVEAHYNKIKNDICVTKKIKALCKKFYSKRNCDLATYKIYYKHDCVFEFYLPVLSFYRSLSYVTTFECDCRDVHADLSINNNYQIKFELLGMTNINIHLKHEGETCKF